MKTQYYGASSLDGFIADEHHSLDWLDRLDASDMTSYGDFIRDVGAIAMGSSTYEFILRHLASVDDPEQARWPYEQPSWIFTSRTLPGVPGADIRFVSGDVAPVHAEMAAVAGEKNVWIAGGGELVGQFYDAGLLDELIIQIASVTLGAGAPLLPRRIDDPSLRLRSVQMCGEGFAELRYEVRYAWPAPS